MSKKKKNRAKVYARRLLRRLAKSDQRFWLTMGVGLLVIIIGVVVYIKKYAPTKESLSVAEYYGTVTDDEAIVFLNGKKMDPAKNATYGNGIYTGGHAYLELAFLKENLDDGYVYDEANGVLRYTTESETISVNRDENVYSSGRNETEMEAPILVEEEEAAFVLLDFVEEFTDVNDVTVSETPARICLETAGYEKTTAVVRKNTVMRQFGGPKSKIVAELKKKDTVTIVGTAGKWLWVINDDGILGCVKSGELKNKQITTIEARLKEREYQHISLNESVCVGWNEITVKADNRNVDSRLSKTKKVNVVVPTWFGIADNSGAVSNLASMEYVSACHNKDIQVWASVSDSLNQDVSTTAVLNNSVARDNLVNNIVAKALAYGIDGVTINFAKVGVESRDGWSQFVRELSLKCENNDLILAVNTGLDNETPQCYNYAVLDNYADYVFAEMSLEGYSKAYDTGITDVMSAAEDTVLESVNPSRLVLGLPLYTRALNEETGEYSGDIQSVDAEFLAKHLESMQSKKLAGAAFWRLGVESDGIWEVISLYMN